MDDNRASRPSPEDARLALDSVAQSRRALASHVRSPAWLYPAQGVGMALFIIGLTLSKHHSWATALLAVSAVIFCALPLLQSRGRVVLDVYTHPGSRGLAWGYASLFGLLTAACLIAYALHPSLWLPVTGGMLALLLTLVMGPLMDSRLENALRHG